MFGDLIIKIEEIWKQFWCIHDYRGIHQTDFRFKQCIKCGRVVR